MRKLVGACFLAVLLIGGASVIYAMSSNGGSNVAATEKESILNGSAATVGKTEITKAELYEAMLRKDGGQTLQEMVIRTFAHEQATAKHLVVGTDELKATMDKVRNSFPSEKEFQSYLLDNGIGEVEFRDQIRMQLEIEKLFSDQLQVGDEQIRQFYELNEASFHHPEQVRVSHILVKTKEKAEELRKELGRGAVFAELAKQFSADVSTRENGGDLGFISAGQSDPAIEKAALGLKVGAYSEPVQTANGYHLVLVTDKLSATTETEEQAKARIAELLKQQKLNELVPAWLAEFTSSGEVRVHIPNPNPNPNPKQSEATNAVSAQ
ncbi:peptidylprolyl isomerase [Cohnella silvisoli]|uniref:peptidylprolyl isomerase n=1 Tax=Cohnella silvisoli TaxID=2873699 RepID=A0ABV1KKR4_9BACL|nr:peptidylprolyl isomerase [Cohnella silvisoli]MCD9020893.1 peptidylprolyl isomerase [Cohnella silvisoli]